LLGEIVSLATFALVCFGATYSASHPSARPSLVQGIVLPTLVFGIGMAIGVRRTRNEQDDSGSSLRDWVADWPPQVRVAVTTALRGGVAAAAGVMLLAAVTTAAAIAVSYARTISLYEALHTEVLGGMAVTLGELAFLPNLVIWTASWLIGPGFSLGTGSGVSPLATQLGPVPAIPVLGALPSGEIAFGFLGLLVPVVVGFLVGAILGPRARRSLARAELILVAIGIGLVGGAVLALLAWASGGAAGPGRLSNVGPNPWAVGLWGALELGVASLIGLLASLRRAQDPTRPHR
jgi:hypothetical protein